MIKIVEEFKTRLNKALADSEKKPVDLAKETGISEATISQYRSGYAKPREQRLVQIANALGVSPSWLMGLDVPMKDEPTDAPSYYTDPETARAAQEAFEQNRALFDAAKDSRPEDIKMAVDLLERLKETNPDG